MEGGVHVDVDFSSLGASAAAASGREAAILPTPKGWTVREAPDVKVASYRALAQASGYEKQATPIISYFRGGTSCANERGPHRPVP